jgi:hypothetical protein
MSNYYLSELKAINTRSPYAPTFQVKSEGHTTKHLSLNKESAAALVSWLIENYLLD